MSSRSWYPRVYLPDTYWLMAWLFAVVLDRRSDDLDPDERTWWVEKIDGMLERCAAATDTESPIYGEYELSRGFAPVLTAPATEFDWSASIVGLDEIGAGQIVQSAASLGARAWALNPDQVISTVGREERIGDN